MSNYDKPLDQVVKDQRKAKTQAKTKKASAALKKAKIGKGGKKPVSKNQVSKNKNFGNKGEKKFVTKKPAGKPGNNNRNSNNKVARNSAPMKKQMVRKAQGSNARGLVRKPQGAQRSGLRSASAMAKTGGINTGLKVHVDNLDFGVTEKDMRELFGEFGGLKNVQMHFDSKGKSQGVCDIHFKTKSDGLRAVKKYNNVPLDGRRMKIDVVGQVNVPVVVSKVQAAKKFVAQQGKKISAVKKQQMKKQLPKKMAGKVGKAKTPSPKKKVLVKKGAKKPVQKKEPKKVVTEEDLDKQLDAYLAAGAV